MSEPQYTRVVIISNDQTTSRVLLSGTSVGQLNAGVTTSAQGLLLPSTPPTTLPQLTAQVYYFDELLDSQPTVFWELSCAKNVATISQDGVITRSSLNEVVSSYDSNGGLFDGAVGCLIQVSATVVRSDGSLSGCRGFLDVVLQNMGARQFAQTDGSSPRAANTPTSSGFFNLIDPAQVGENYSN